MSARMPHCSLAILFAAVLALGCSQSKPAPFEPEDHSVRDDREAPFNPPERYPEWAFDQPEYVKPAVADEPAPTARVGDPAHYFTNKRVVMVEQPTGYDPEEAPRIAVYYTNDNGFHWHKAGYFGRQQSFFPLETDADGDYGVRFVGPGQEPAEHTPAYPARMYHVDTMLPEVFVRIEPEKTWYGVGDDVRIVWGAKDPHLEQFPVRIGMLMDFTAMEHDLIEVQRDLPDNGTIDYKISSETEGHEIVFRVEALDRAGNLGLAYSHALQVKEREEQQITRAAAAHHDDRLPVSPNRKTTDKSAPVTSPILAVDMAPTSGSRSAAVAKSHNEKKEKTRVKVVTFPREERDTGATTLTPPANPVTSPVATMHQESAKANDADIAQMMDCDERAKYEATITPSTTSETSPVAKAPTPAPAPTNTISALSIEDALASVKDAIGKMRDYKPATSTQTNASPAPVVPAKVAPAAPSTTPVVTNAAPVRIEPARPVTVTKTNTNTMNPTQTNGLVAPMPGTVATTDSGVNASHPWLSLGGTSASADRTWGLPDAKDNVTARPGKAQSSTPVFAGTPKEDETPAPRPE